MACSRQIFHHIGITLILASCTVLAFAFDQPMILWTQHSHVWSKIQGLMSDSNTWLALDHGPYVQTQSLKFTFRYGLSYNPVTNDVIWSDISQHKIFKQNLQDALDKNNDTITEIFYKEGSKITSLAVDWVSGSCYFVDETTREIGVISLSKAEASLHKVIFKAKVKKPNSIAVDPYDGLLFWTDEGKGTIESSTTSGVGHTIISTNLRKPRGIALDYSSEHIYYVDSEESTINKVDYNGDWKQELYRDSDNRGYLGITVMDNYIFVTTGDNLQIDLHMKSNGTRILSADIDASIYHIVSIQNHQTPPHECNAFSCDHICLNTGPDHKAVCVCGTGYTLQQDGKSCSENYPSYVTIKNNAVIYTDAFIEENNGTQVTLSHKIIRKDALEARAVAVHYEKQLVYYSDVETDVIYQGDIMGNSWREITVNARYVEGLAIDWTTNVLFWTDKILNHIMCSKLSGHFHRIHVKDVTEPKNLALDAIRKRLIWSSLYRIEAVGIDGMDRNVLVKESNGGSLTGDYNGVVVDSATSRIYWTNRYSGYIESVDLDGQDRKIINNNIQIGLYGVALYGDYLSYTKQQSDSIEFYHLKEKVDINKVFNDWIPTVKPNLTTDETYYETVLFHSYSQPFFENACERNNGGCSQLCFPEFSGGRTCGCAIGYQLRTDQVSCDSETGESHFVMFIDPYHKQIYQMDTAIDLEYGSSYKTQGIPVPQMEFPTSLAYDVMKKRVYWIDRTNREIKSSSLDGTDSVVIRSLSMSSRARRLALDPESRSLYYTDTGDRSIHKINIDSRRHTVFINNLYNAISIAVDKENSYIYWSNEGELKRSSTKGMAQQETVFSVINQQLSAISISNGNIFISIWETGDLYMIDATDMNNSTLLATVGAGVSSLASNSKYLYYSKWNEKGVYRVNINDGQGVTVLDSPVFARITDIVAVEDLPEPPINPLIVIIGSTAGALFFLALLACLFALLFVKSRKKKKTPSSTPAPFDNGTSTPNSFDSLDQDADYMLYSSGATMGLHSPFPRAPAAKTKDSLSTDSGVSALSATSSTADLIQNSPDLSVQGAENRGFHNSPAESSGVPVLPVGIPPPVLSKRFRKNPKSTRKQIHNMKPPNADLESPNNFNLRDDKKVATVIHRLANRLRKRLSSVRYDDDPQPRPSIETNNPGDPSIEMDTAIDPLRDYPEKQKMPPNKRRIHIPDKLHKEPRGWAPASHNVPRFFKSSLGKAKGQEMRMDDNVS